MSNFLKFKTRLFKLCSNSDVINSKRDPTAGDVKFKEQSPSNDNNYHGK